jgi:hypothetical protein
MAELAEAAKNGDQSAIDALQAMRADGLIDELIELHHLLPQEKALKPYFKRAGLNIENFKIPLDVAKHRLKPDGIHTKGGGDWNKVWTDFFKNNQLATQEQILEQLARMRKQFGI